MAMETSNTTASKYDRKFALTHIGKCLAGLLDCILTDAVADIEVAARDLQISDASFIRLRRAMDRVACAQSVLETVRAGSAGAECGETAKCAETRMRMRMVEAVELLAKEWPEDYPAGTVEWLLLQSSARPGTLKHFDQSCSSESRFADC